MLMSHDLFKSKKKKWNWKLDGRQIYSPGSWTWTLKIYYFRREKYNKISRLYDLCTVTQFKFSTEKVRKI